MMSNYYKNALKITLHGHKLKGDFILIKFKDDKYEDGWRLIKADDRYASNDDVLKKDKSVKIKLTIEQMAENNQAAVWQSNRGAKKQEPANDVPTLIRQGIQKAMPESVKPMFCTLTKVIVTDNDYLYEVKWDGYRIISFIDGKNVRMNSRSALDYTHKYPPLLSAVVMAIVCF